jgi:hypothetical protein
MPKKEEKVDVSEILKNHLSKSRAGASPSPG